MVLWIKDAKKISVDFRASLHARRNTSVKSHARVRHMADKTVKTPFSRGVTEQGRTFGTYGDLYRKSLSCARSATLGSEIPCRDAVNG
jgi:hypothetical protein